MKYREQVLQERFSHWLDSKKILFTSSMVGVFLPVKYAVLRKKMGVKSGYPDIMIFEPKGKFHGLFIELKSDIGRISNEQENVIEELNKRGYKALIMPLRMDFQIAFNWLRNRVEEYMNQQIKTD